MIKKTKKLTTKYKYDNNSIQDIKKDFPGEIEETLNIYISWLVFKVLKTEFPDRGNYLNKRLEFFNEDLAFSLALMFIRNQLTI